MEEIRSIYHKEFGSMNVAIVNGKEYFPAIVCAKALGYKNPREAVLKHCKCKGSSKLRPPLEESDEEVCSSHETDSKNADYGIVQLEIPTNGGMQKVKYISEGNLYRLIVHSRLPSAERFEAWVFDEVLPEIRKTGSYGHMTMETISKVTATVVREILPEILKEMVTVEEKKQSRRAHGKIDKLPQEIREKVLYMLYKEKNTYEEIQIFLNQAGYEIHFSSIGRFCRRMEKQANDWLG